MASPSSAACPPAMFAISRPTRTVAPAPLARASAAPRFALGGPRAVAKPTGAERFLRARGGQASTSGRSHHVAASAGPASRCLRRRATRRHVRTRGASGDCDARPSSRAERAAESAPEEDGTSPPSSPLPELLTLSTTRAALRIGSPVVAMGLLRSAFNLTDTYWAGTLGAAQLSALMHNAFALWIIQLACTVVATGLQARVSSLVGAGDDAAVSRAVVQGLWGAAATYLLLLLVSPFVPALYASGIGIEPGTPAYAHGASHLLALLVGSAGVAAASVLEAAFRGLGKTQVALLVTIVSVALAAALDPALMFGWGPFPRLGVAGAAAGASVASAFAAALHVRALRRSCGVSLEWAPPNLSEIAGMVRVGLPLASNGVVFTLVYIAIGRVASGCGEQNLAALGLGQKFEAVAFTVIEGFRLACATLVGQWVGAGKPRRARNAAAVSVALCVAAMAPFVAALFSLGPTLAGSVGADPATAAAAGSYLRWNSGALLFLALEAVTEGAFTGAGNTVPVLVVGTLCNLARVPAAHYLAFAAGWGVEGVWAAIVASQILKGLLKSWWFRTRVMTDLERKAGGGENDEDEGWKRGFLGLAW